MANHETVKVWDPLVRLFHWSLVLAFFVAYFTEDELLGTHVVAGYIVLGLVIVRILWGFIGPKYARFTDFVYAPATILSDLRASIRLRARQRHLGHSPAGGAMVLLLLLMLLGTTVTGMMDYGADKHRGPLAPVMGTRPVTVISMPVARADEENGAGAARSENESALKEIHEALANITLALIGLHVLAVLLASFSHHENLIGAMITGRKLKEIASHSGTVEGEGHAET